MASVNEVYSALKNLANKDERGFITPKVFNTFTSIAQNKIFNDLFKRWLKLRHCVCVMLMQKRTTLTPKG